VLREAGGYWAGITYIRGLIVHWLRMLRNHGRFNCQNWVPCLTHLQQLFTLRLSSRRSFCTAAREQESSKTWFPSDTLYMPLLLHFVCGIYEFVYDD